MKKAFTMNPQDEQEENTQGTGRDHHPPAHFIARLYWQRIAAQVDRCERQIWDAMPAVASRGQSEIVFGRRCGLSWRRCFYDFDRSCGVCCCCCCFPRLSKDVMRGLTVRFRSRGFTVDAPYNNEWSHIVIQWGAIRPLSTDTPPPIAADTPPPIRRISNRVQE